MSGFEKAFTDSYGHNVDDPDEHIIFACKGLADDIWQHQQAKIDELQARVDKVVHILTYTNHASTPLCNELRDILKGNKDEN